MFTSHSRRGVCLPASALVLAAGLAGSREAFAQTRTWVGASGAWSVPSNWSSSDVPDTASESAALGGASSYTVNTGGSFNIGALLLSNSLASLLIDTGTSLGLSVDSTNNGTITVNPTGVNSSTSLAINALALTMSGTGSIVLNANAASTGSAYIYFNSGANVLTLGAGQTLRGSGDVYPQVVNNGTIQADQSGKPLQLINQAKTNNNVMQAIGGGILNINSVAIAQGGSGSILANGGTVNFSNVPLTGGALTVSGGGAANILGGCTFTNVSVTGPLTIPAGNGLAVAGPLTSNGTITINPAGTTSSTHLDVNTAALTLAGTGSIVLNANAGSLDSAYLYFNAGSNVLTVPATQTIRGTGNIYTNVVNNGTIQADQTGKVLQLFNQSKTNNSVIQAINGGILNISNIGITQGSSGAILANASPVNLSAATLTGGALTVSNGGSVTITGSSTFSNVSVTGPLALNAGNALLVSGPLTSNGTITINPAGTTSSTHLDVNTAALTLAGTGSIVLNANAGSLDSAYLYFNAGSNVLTVPATQTIRGTGNIYTNVTNNGTIQADQTGKVLQLFNQSKTNNSVIQAINGGILNIGAITLTQGSSGSILANASPVNLSGTTLTGGALTMSSGGSATITGSSTFNNVAVTGPWALNAGLVLSLTGPISNNGTLTINPSGSSTTTHMDINVPSLTVGGTGTILLNANAATLDSAYFNTTSGTNVLTLGPGQTLAGRGRLYARVNLQGTIAPGSGPGVTDRIDISGAPFVMAPTATLDVEIGGTAPAQFDRITSNSTFTLDGLVRVRLVNGFTNPAPGTSFDIVTASSVLGSCVRSDMPKGWSLFTHPGVVRVQYSNCPADLDCGNGVGTPDSGVDINDLLYFLANYEAGLTPADLDDGSGTGTPDGGVDINDLLYFLDHYEAGC